MNEYLEQRGFNDEIQKDWKLETKDGEVLINYLDKEGNLLYTRRNRPGKDPKYISPPSNKLPGHSVLYGLQMTEYIKDNLLLIEGEYNCISAWYMGFQALGVAGQSMSLRDYLLKDIPESVEKITILYDEIDFAQKRAEEILKYYENNEKNIKVYIAKYPDNKDANDYLKEGLAIDFKAIINTADRYLEDQLKSTNIKVEIPNNDFVEAYKNYALQISDAPAKYQELMALSVIATILQRQVYIKYGVSNLYPNLYIVLIGKSTIMRKTACLNIAKHLIRKFNSELILPNDFTPEGLFNLLTEKPVGLVSWSEFGAFLVSTTKSYQAGVKEFLTEAYDCPEQLNKRLSGKEYSIANIYLNIITATTLHWFIDRITEADTLGGFLGRFIYMPCTKDDKNGWYYMPQNEPINESNMLLKSINEISKIKGEFTISEDAKTLLIKWLRRHEDELEALDDSKGIMGFYARLSDYLLKFAMLYEISASRKLLISESSLMRAIKLVNQLKLSLNELMSNHIAFTQEAKDMQKVLNIIKDNEQIPRGLLLRNSNMTSKQLDEVIRTLEQSGRIKSYFVNEGKKRTLVYTAIGS